MKPFWKSKTIVFNALSILVILLAETRNSDIVPFEYAPYIIIVINVINIILRDYFIKVPIQRKRVIPND